MRRLTQIEFSIAFILIFGLGMFFRLPDLGARPFHGDEANQAVKAGILYDTGRYEYDPHEHHGPTLYYGVLPLLWLNGAGTADDAAEIPYRLLPALFGLGLILVLLPLRKSLGDATVLTAALLTALSPAMTYYARYFIQETLFVFFAFAAILAVAAYLRKPGLAAALGAGVLFGLVHATKETSVVLYACMGFSLFAAAVLDRDTRQSLRARFSALPPVHAGALILGAAVVVVVLFSAFFTRARGPLDAFLTYQSYFIRAEGTGSAALHDKPWYYYLELLAYTYREAGPRWSEAPVLIFGALGIGVSLLRPPVAAPVLSRFLALYALSTLAVFSLIPYKTPWNLLPFYQPLLIMAGAGAGYLLTRRIVALRAVTVIALLASSVWLGRQAYQANFVYAADTRNPYVYAHTSTALRRLVARVEEIAAVHPDGKHMHINLITPEGDYWPLPWYLRHYDQVGYWTTMPDPADAPMLIVDARLREAVMAQLKDEYQIEYHALRPDVNFFAFIRRDLWEAFMAERNAAQS